MLKPTLLLAAYRQGIFPMAVDATGRIGWFSPDPRAIIPLDERFHVPHGLRRVLKKLPFTMTVNRAFREVIRECSVRSEGTWISPGIIKAYTQLHRLGHAHSVEVWWPPLPGGRGEGDQMAVPSPRLRGEGQGEGPQLVGGLYGVALGGAFFGESMFHRVTDASKVALVFLVERLRARGYTLLDTQWLTPHLSRFGACEISRAEYLTWLADALSRDCHFD